ncbi:MAG: cyclase family protein [Bacilli bacterium]
MARYDVTMLVSETMPVYKNKVSKKPVFTKVSQIAQGASTNETDVHFNVHTGTHVDFPLHVKSGALSSRAFDITTFIRPVKVLDFMDVKDGISSSDLKTKNILKGDFVLLKTQNSAQEVFDFNFIYLKADGARYLADLGVSGVGIDGLGIERDQRGHPSHHTLMDNGIWIIEGLRLQAVKEGPYRMVALPLKLDDVDALPLTVILED